MNIKKINIHEFAKKYNENYSFLYDYEGSDYDQIVGEYCDVFDNYFSKKHKDFIVEFVEYRGWDPISSDREAAAFVMTMEEMINNEIEA